jgi:hypothetical protein
MVFSGAVCLGRCARFFKSRASNVPPQLDPLRGDPRFQALTKKSFRLMKIFGWEIYRLKSGVSILS